MAVMMAPIRSACQNAENAHFEKRAILVEFWGGSKMRIYLFVEKERFLFLIVVVGETVSAPRFLLYLCFCIFPLFQLT